MGHGRGDDFSSRVQRDVIGRLQENLPKEVETLVVVSSFVGTNGINRLKLLFVFKKSFYDFKNLYRRRENCIIKSHVLITQLKNKLIANHVIFLS